MPHRVPTPLELEEVRAEEAQFELALGRLMLAWADVELELYRVLIYYADVSDAVGRAIFSGARARAMVDFITNICHNIQVAGERRENLDALFAHLQAINTVRDRVVHFASASSYSWASPSARAITNAARVNRTGREFVYDIGSIHLDQMTDDLYLIMNHLQTHRSSRTDFRPWQEEPASVAAWRFKPINPA